MNLVASPRHHSGADDRVCIPRPRRTSTDSVACRRLRESAASRRAAARRTGVERGVERVVRRLRRVARRDARMGGWRWGDRREAGRRMERVRRRARRVMMARWRRRVGREGGGFVERV